MVGHTTKFEGTINLQRAQYEELCKVAEATTKFEGLPEVIESQENNIEELKANIETIQSHIISHTVLHNETDRELAIIPIIQDNQELMMLHMVDLLKTLNGDDAKRRGEAPRRGIVFEIPQKKMATKPCLHVPQALQPPKKENDWFDASKTICTN